MIKIVLGFLLASVALALPLSAQTSAKAATPVRAAGQILATRVRGSVSVTDTSEGTVLKVLSLRSLWVSMVTAFGRPSGWQLWQLYHWSRLRRPS